MKLAGIRREIRDACRAGERTGNCFVMLYCNGESVYIEQWSMDSLYPYIHGDRLAAFRLPYGMSRNEISALQRSLMDIEPCHIPEGAYHFEYSVGDTRSAWRYFDEKRGNFVHLADDCEDYVI